VHHASVRASPTLASLGGRAEPLAIRAAPVSSTTSSSNGSSLLQGLTASATVAGLRPCSSAMWWFCCDQEDCCTRPLGCTSDTGTASSSVACGSDSRLERRLLTVLLPQRHRASVGWSTGVGTHRPTRPGVCRCGASGRASASPNAPGQAHPHSPSIEGFCRSLRGPFVGSLWHRHPATPIPRSVTVSRE